MNVQHAHCDEGNMPIAMKGKMPRTIKTQHAHRNEGKNAYNSECLERPNATCHGSHANMHMTQLSPIIVWHGNAAFTNIRFWGHVVSVVLFFNKMSLNMISRNQINKKCVVAHARCVSPATPKMFPIFSKYHF